MPEIVRILRRKWRCKPSREKGKDMERTVEVRTKAREKAAVTPAGNQDT